MQRIIEPRSLNRVCIYALALSMLTVLIGCGGRTVRSDSIVECRAGVVAAREQARVVFGDANGLARERSLQRVQASSRSVLREEDFAVVVEPPAVAQWDNAFGVFDDYVSALQQLTSPGRSGALRKGNWVGTGRGPEPASLGAVTVRDRLQSRRVNGLIDSTHHHSPDRAPAPAERRFPPIPGPVRPDSRAGLIENERRPSEAALGRGTRAGTTDGLIPHSGAHGAFAGTAHLSHDGRR
jgi:hypothetical protein